MLLAFLPQHVWEVGVGVFAAVSMMHGVSVLRGNRLPGENPRSAVRGGVFQIVLGVALAVAAFTVNSEPSCGGCGRGHWGGTWGVLILIVWLVLFALSARLAGHLGSDARGKGTRSAGFKRLRRRVPPSDTDGRGGW
jgi:hypothetical protein